MQHRKCHGKVILNVAFVLAVIFLASKVVSAAKSGWMSWGPWSEKCPRKCHEEVGYQSRTRSCQICVGDQCIKAMKGTNCPGGGDNEGFRTCYEPKCEGRGVYFGAWTAWQRTSDCKPAGDPCQDFQKDRLGATTFKRSCKDPEGLDRRILCSDVTGKGNTKRDNCTFPCPVRDGNWGTWGRWSRCSVTCGKGSYTRRRACNNPPPMGKGKICSGAETSTMACARESKCPVDGGWGDWSEWSCTVTCGKVGGTGQRERKCDNPPPESEKNGRPCQGPATDVTKGCNDFTCPSVGDLTISLLSPMIKAKIWNELQSSDVSFVKREGENFQIQCPLKLLEMIRRDFPSAKLSWLRNGKPLSLDPERVVNFNGQLMFSTLTPEDSGVYFCEAEYEPPMTQTIGVSTVVVKSDKPTLKAKEDSMLEIPCNAEQFTDILTEPKREWYQNDNKFSPESTGDIDYANDDSPSRVKVQGDLLQFSKVVPAYAGTWECRVTDVTTKRTWSTNWHRLKVLPPATGWERFSENPKYFGSAIGAGVGVILILCLVCVCRSKPEGDDAAKAVEKMRLLDEQDEEEEDNREEEYDVDGEEDDEEEGWTEGESDDERPYDYYQ